MKFKLTNGTLEVTDIQPSEFMRLTSIELAILKRIGSVKQDPTVNGATKMHFAPEYTEDVRSALIDFMVDA